MIKKSLSAQTQVLLLFSTFRFLKGKLPYHCDTGIAYIKINVRHKISYFYLSIDLNLYVYFRFLFQRRCTRFLAHLCSAPYRAVHGQCITPHIDRPSDSVSRPLGYVFIFIRNTLLEYETNLT